MYERRRLTIVGYTGTGEAHDVVEVVVIVWNHALAEDTGSVTTWQKGMKRMCPGEFQ